MKIKTYTARDMKGALRQVREEQGPDAVILSTRHFDGGVEVSIAMEPDEALLLDAAAAAPPAIEARFGNELRSMRQLLESQLSQLAWTDLTRRAPAQAALLQELSAMGIAGPLATALLQELPAGIAPDDAHRRALAALTRRVRTTGDELLDQGGRVAFVGPTGVGKTTGIAKLAARWVMRHGPRDIALVSLDDTRFGAHEQLRVLGRLLGVECYALDDAAGLDALLARLPQHRMVLIDTAGISPRDPQVSERALVLGEVARRCNVQFWLTLSAGAQAGGQPRRNSLGAGHCQPAGGLRGGRCAHPRGSGAGACTPAGGTRGVPGAFQRYQRW
jgi:flagellar biosynthesis protein FlhF